MSTVTPPQRKRDHIPNSKSSDSLPSPNELLGLGNRRLKTGSRAAGLPQDVAVGFTSTSVLLKYNLLNLRSAEEAIAEPAKQAISKSKAKDVDGRTKAAKAAKKKAAEDVVGITLTAPKEAVKEKKFKETKESDVKIARPRKRKSDEIEAQPIPKKCASVLTKHAHDTAGSENDNAAGPAEPKEKPAPKPRKRRKTAETTGIDDNLPAPAVKSSKPRKKTVKKSSHFADQAQDIARNPTADVSQPQLAVTNEIIKAYPGPVNSTVNLVKDGTAILVETSVQSETVTAKGRKTSKSSSHFLTGSELVPPAEPVVIVDESVQFDAAVKRKVRWTPPKTGHTEQSTEIDIYSVPSSSPKIAEAESVPPKIDFAVLQNKFGYDNKRDSASASPSRDAQVGSMMRPGRRLELIPDLQHKPITIIQEQPGPVVAMPTREELQADSAKDLPAPPQREARKKASPRKKIPLTKKTSSVKKAPRAKKVATTKKDSPKKVSPKKNESPKKGPGGITGRSIARYALPEQAVTAIVKDANLSPHFALIFEKPAETVSKASSVIHELLEGSTEAKEVAKPRRSRAKKGDTENPLKEAKKKPSAKAKAMPPPHPKLASPKQHNAKLERQDILFGSSSQLRQDLSPDLVRVLQQSLQESAPGDTELEIDSIARVQGRRAAAFRSTRRKLWGESHYAPTDEDDSFRDISEFDMLGTIHADTIEHVVGSFNRAASTANPFAPVINAPAAHEHEAGPVPSNGFFLTIGNDEQLIHSPSYLDLPNEDHAANDLPVLPAEVEGISPTANDLDEGDARFTKFSGSEVGTGRLDVFKDSVSQPAVMSTAITISSDSPREASPPRAALRPLTTNAKSPTKTQNESKLVKKKDTTATVEVDAAKKPPRGRSRKDTVADVPTKAAKPDGRPRKIAPSSPGPRTPRKQDKSQKQAVSGAKNSPTRSSAEKERFVGFRDIDDIEDDEPNKTPSPRRRRGSPTASQELPLTTNEEHEVAVKQRNTAIVNPSHPRWPTAKAKLFPEITAQVKGAPATGNIKNPSWYEKMLLYDPIVLEDLTTWLNEQGLRLEGKDKEMVELSGWMTQAWCEANSVCCLWREGLRGGVRTRY